MNVTFGIITQDPSTSNEKLLATLQSIYDNGPPGCEILIPGDEDQAFEPGGRIVPPMSSRRHPVNTITEHAGFEDMAFIREGAVLLPGWGEGIEAYGDYYKVCVCRVVTPEGARHTDWTLWCLPRGYHKKLGIGPYDLRLPYDETRMSRLQYVPGTCWMAKKGTMQDVPVNDRMSHGWDVDWSMRVRDHCNFSMNPYSSVEVRPDEYDLVFDDFPEDKLDDLMEMACVDGLLP